MKGDARYDVLAYAVLACSWLLSSQGKHLRRSNFNRRVWQPGGRS
jgi:hypothetical protein